MWRVPWAGTWAKQQNAINFSQKCSSVAPDPAESRGAPPPPQDPSPLRGTLGSSLRSPAEGEGHEGFPPPPENGERPWPEKVGLKLNIQKTKIMASGPITPWQIDGETMKTVTDFILGPLELLSCTLPWPLAHAEQISDDWARWQRAKS